MANGAWQDDEVASASRQQVAHVQPWQVSGPWQDDFALMEPPHPGESWGERNADVDMGRTMQRKSGAGGPALKALVDTEDEIREAVREGLMMRDRRRQDDPQNVAERRNDHDLSMNAAIPRLITPTSSSSPFTDAADSRGAASGSHERYVRSPDGAVPPKLATGTMDMEANPESDENDVVFAQRTRTGHTAASASSVGKQPLETKQRDGDLGDVVKATSTENKAGGFSAANGSVRNASVAAVLDAVKGGGEENQRRPVLEMIRGTEKEHEALKILRQVEAELIALKQRYTEEIEAFRRSEDGVS